MRDNSAHTRRVLSTYIGMIVNSPITLSNYKYDAYTVRLGLK